MENGPLYDYFWNTEQTLDMTFSELQLPETLNRLKST